MKCPNCNHEVKEGMLFCQKCGTKMEAAEEQLSSIEQAGSLNLVSAASLNCPACGEPFTANQRFCRNCGTKLEGYPKEDLVKETKEGEEKGRVDSIEKQLSQNEEHFREATLKTEACNKETIKEVIAGIEASNIGTSPEKSPKEGGEAGVSVQESESTELQETPLSKLDNNTATPVRVEGGTFGWALLSFFITLIGFILYLTWKEEYPKRAQSCKKGALVGVIVCVILYIIKYAIEYYVYTSLFSYY